MAMLIRRAVKALLITGIVGVSWHFYELHQELQRLKTDVHHLQIEIMELAKRQSDVERMIHVDSYRVLALQWAKDHPAPTPKPKPMTPKWQTFRMSAYIAKCKEGCTGKTATGYKLTSAKKDRVIAVDPKIIPLYSLVEIEGYGIFRALDTGGKIRGKKIDLFVDTTSYARKIGVRHVKLRIIERGKPKTKVS